MKSYRILLLDNDFVVSALRRELLSKSYAMQDGLEIESFTSPVAALARVREPDGYFDLVIVDIRMPEMSGIDFLRQFGDIQPDAARVILSGDADMQELRRTINEAHIDFFIAKPWHEFDLRSGLWQALRQYDLRCENRNLAKQYIKRFGAAHQFKRKDIYQLMILDDDPNVLHALQRELGVGGQERFGLYQLEVHRFERIEAALQAAREQQFDVVISDYAMPGMNGIEFLHLFREAQSDAVRILLSGTIDMEVFAAAVNMAGVNYFIAKPWSDYELRGAIDRALTYRELALENRFLAEMLRLRSKH